MWSNGTNVSNSSNRGPESNISPKVVSASIVAITLDKKSEQGTDTSSRVQ